MGGYAPEYVKTQRRGRLGTQSTALLYLETMEET